MFVSLWIGIVLAGGQTGCTTPTKKVANTPEVETRRAVAVGTAAVLPGAPAEQLRKQLHGRFPLTETDPPVGQDEP